MKAIRWFNTKNINCNPTAYSWFVKQERDGRQRSMEFLPKELDTCWANPECVGLLLDMDNTLFHRGYCEDSYTFVNENGERVSEAVDEEPETDGEFWCSQWKDAEKVFWQVSLEERESWAEGVVSHAKYLGVVVLPESPPEIVEKLCTEFGLEVVLTLTSQITVLGLEESDD